MPPIEQACYWLARRPPRPKHPLAGSEDADVAIVGAGLTGLWTALWLKRLEPGTDVVVVEQEVAGFGGSGRNAGMLSETIDHSHGLALRHFGEAEARRLARLGEQNVSELLGFLAERGIDCDFEATGRLSVALTESQVEECRAAVAVARRLGLESFRFLSGEEVRTELRSPLYQAAVAVQGGGILDPVKLVDGLRIEAERLGVRVYDATRVEALTPAARGAAVRASTGQVRSRQVVLAANAYSHRLLPGLVHRYIPLYDYILVSAPLTVEQREALGWRSRQGITDCRTFFNYYRLTRDSRVLFGTSEAHYWGRNRVGPECDHSEPHYRSLRESWVRTFPQLASLEWEYAWGGPICSTTRLTPFFGQALGGRVLYGLGYTGHGLGSTHLAGKILAHRAIGRASELLDLALVRRKPIPFPPEPLRSWAVHRVARALRQVDRGARPGLVLRMLERLGIGFSS